MNILITAGNTQIPLDNVRVITNIFSGRTGAYIARAASERGHKVSVLTSHPEHLTGLPDHHDPDRRTTIIPYKTYDDMASALEHATRAGGFDAIVLSAAVSDYLCAGVFAPTDGTTFDGTNRTWERPEGPPTLAPVSGGKIKSEEPELWVRLTRAPKLVDKVRTQWGYHGVLVKFKLEVGITDEDLLQIAEASRTHSDADFMVANTLEGAATHAFIGPVAGNYQKVSRRELPDRLLNLIEQKHRMGTSVHG